VVGFQRARSPEQREVRRAAILDTAAAMLAELPVAEVSLNELSRRAGLAKSNVLRYFDSREAVLLELLDRAVRDWLAEVGPTLTGVSGDLVARREGVAAALAGSLAARPVLCDLLAAQSAVLERNVSPAVAARFKRALLAQAGELAAAVRAALPELPAAAAARFAGAAALVAGATWSACQPSPAMLEAYAADPALAALRVEVGPALRELLATLLAGFLARPDADLS
jgi:AcrR family transcriptional regulator